MRRRAIECYYCGIPLGGRGKRRRTLDHVKPLSKGGTYRVSNLVVCCSRCNGLKSNYTRKEIALEIEKRLKYVTNDSDRRELKYLMECFRHPKGAENVKRKVQDI